MKENFWLLSPSSYNNGANIYTLSGNRGLTSSLVTENYFLRPVINIKGDLIIKSGNGDISDPFILETDQNNVEQ